MEGVSKLNIIWRGKWGGGVGKTVRMYQSGEGN